MKILYMLLLFYFINEIQKGIVEVDGSARDVTKHTYISEMLRHR
jgi:hypothetical protein